MIVIFTSKQAWKNEHRLLKRKRGSHYYTLHCTAKAEAKEDQPAQLKIKWELQTEGTKQSDLHVLV